MVNQDCSKIPAGKEKTIRVLDTYRRGNYKNIKYGQVLYEPIFSFRIITVPCDCVLAYTSAGQ